MAGHLMNGAVMWGGERDEEGHRTYHIKVRVRTDSVFDGPAVVLQTPGLPRTGSIWKYDNDVDIWAWFRPTAKVQMVQGDGEPGVYWTVELMASTKPPTGKEKRRCQDTEIQDPLLEPFKIAGGFAKLKKEATKDRFGQPIVNSAYEQLRGPQVEFDENRPTVKIEQNVAKLGIEVFSAMMDTVNIAPLWGLPKRCVKLSNATWERKFKGICELYYTRTFEFETNAIKDENGNLVSGFDRDLLDEGTKVLHGHWGTNANMEGYGWVLDNIGSNPPDPGNPAHFDRFKDRNGENARVVLDGRGKPIDAKVFGAVEGASTDTPIVIQSKANGLKAADVVAITGVQGNTGANGLWIVNTGMDQDHFIILNSTPTGAYTTGGIWRKIASGGQLVNDGGKIHVEKYEESDFLQLGIPSDLNTTS